MKKLLFVTLALLLAACGASPVEQAQPTPIVQTVVVVATTESAPPTAVPLPTQGPTNTPLPVDTPTSVPPTTEPTTAASPTAEASAGNTSDLTPVVVDNTLGKGVFADITFSSDLITLNCYPREFEITMRAIHPDVTRAEMYYRVLEAPSYFRYSDWYPLGNLSSDGNGNFFITFEATDINPDWRALEQGVLEFQFIGVNKGGGVVGRTEKIERLIKYYKECPPTP